MKNYLFFFLYLIDKVYCKEYTTKYKRSVWSFFGKMPLNTLIIRSAKKIKKEYKDIVDFFIKLIIFQLNI